MKRKIIVLMLCLFSFAVLCGCSIIEADPMTYPAMECVDTSGLALESVQKDSITTMYEADNWTVQEEATLLTLMLTDALEESYVTNITVQVSSEYEAPFKNKDLNDLYRVFSSSGYSVFDKFELRRLNGEVIIYIEAVTEFTDKLIDKLMEQGMLTEASMDAMGGREALLAYPKTYQTMIYTIQGGRICVYTGTCYSSDQIQPVREQMLILIQNAQIQAVK